ncbi:unnamed protein product [Allacma fusca]|uniref:Farnesoic acid O-methyl transferase domain-containing protein n=1 Tax=Allacma fusca TaxID=39272 RepID=A0A8J2L7V8_9HEXA|nr:unnamed protein product [Allacma fusca]
MCALVSRILLSVIVIDAAFAISTDLGHAFTLECDDFCSCTPMEVESQAFIHFPDETCEVQNLTGYEYRPCYKIPPHFDSDNKIKVFFKFQGDSDGHVRLEDKIGQGYEVVFGSWNNVNTEIRTIHKDKSGEDLKALHQTVGILSPEEFRSFSIEYDKNEKKLEVIELETRQKKLLSWVDGTSFDLRYVSFSGFHSDKIVQVAFNCTATHKSSIMYLTSLAS